METVFKLLKYPLNHQEQLLGFLQGVYFNNLYISILTSHWLNHQKVNHIAQYEVYLRAYIDINKLCTSRLTTHWGNFVWVSVCLSLSLLPNIFKPLLRWACVQWVYSIVQLGPNPERHLLWMTTKSTDLKLETCSFTFWAPYIYRIGSIDQNRIFLNFSQGKGVLHLPGSRCW